MSTDEQLKRLEDLLAEINASDYDDDVLENNGTHTIDDEEHALSLPIQEAPVSEDTLEIDRHDCSGQLPEDTDSSKVECRIEDSKTGSLPSVEKKDDAVFSTNQEDSSSSKHKATDSPKADSIGETVSVENSFGDSHEAILTTPQITQEIQVASPLTRKQKKNKKKKAKAKKAKQDGQPNQEITDKDHQAADELAEIKTSVLNETETRGSETPANSVAQPAAVKSESQKSSGSPKEEGGAAVQSETTSYAELQEDAHDVEGLGIRDSAASSLQDEALPHRGNKPPDLSELASELGKVKSQTKNTNSEEQQLPRYNEKSITDTKHTLSKEHPASGKDQLQLNSSPKESQSFEGKASHELEIGLNFSKKEDEDHIDHLSKEEQDQSHSVVTADEDHASEADMNNSTIHDDYSSLGTSAEDASADQTPKEGYKGTDLDKEAASFVEQDKVDQSQDTLSGKATSSTTHQSEPATEPVKNFTEAADHHSKESNSSVSSEPHPTPQKDVKKQNYTSRKESSYTSDSLDASSHEMNASSDEQLDVVPIKSISSNDENSGSLDASPKDEAAQPEALRSNEPSTSGDALPTQSNSEGGATEVDPESKDLAPQEGPEKAVERDPSSADEEAQPVADLPSAKESERAEVRPEHSKEGTITAKAPLSPTSANSSALRVSQSNDDLVSLSVDEKSVNDGDQKAEKTRDSPQSAKQAAESAKPSSELADEETPDDNGEGSTEPVSKIDEKTDSSVRSAADFLDTKPSQKDSASVTAEPTERTEVNEVSETSKPAPEADRTESKQEASNETRHDDPNSVLLFVSLASGVRGTMGRYNKAANILNSYDIKFTPVEITLDQRALRLWKLKGVAKNKVLPAVFRDGDMKCDFNELVEANEIEDVEDLIFDGL